MAKILIVDDSSTVRDEVAGFLKAAGLEVATAIDGKDGLAKIKADPGLKLVVCDVNMPNMDGIEFVRNLRDNYYYMDTPVIMLTTTKDDKLKKDAFDAGVNMFLNKPVQPNFLLYKVESLLQEEGEVNG